MAADRDVPDQRDQPRYSGPVSTAAASSWRGWPAGRRGDVQVLHQMGHDQVGVRFVVEAAQRQVQHVDAPDGEREHRLLQPRPGALYDVGTVRPGQPGRVGDRPGQHGQAGDHSLPACGVAGPGATEKVGDVVGRPSRHCRCSPMRPVPRRAGRVSRDAVWGGMAEAAPVMGGSLQRFCAIQSKPSFAPRQLPDRCRRRTGRGRLTRQVTAAGSSAQQLVLRAV